MAGSEPEDTPREDEPEIAVVGDAAAPSTATCSPRWPTCRPGATFGSLVHVALEHTDPVAPEHGGDLQAEIMRAGREAAVRWPVAARRRRRSPRRWSRSATRRSGRWPATRCARSRCGTGSPSWTSSCRSTAATTARQHVVRDPGRPRTDPRRHLRPGDPLLPYADVVDDPAYAAQRLRGYLTGSVDVVLRVGQRYLVVDYKTNWLGPTDEPLPRQRYRPEAWPRR